MTPSIWLDAARRRVPTRPCWTCGRERPILRFRGEELAWHGWLDGQTMGILGWCGCQTEYLPVLERPGCWLLVPIWEPGGGADPGRRSEPPKV